MITYAIRWTLVWVIWCHFCMFIAMLIVPSFRPELLIPNIEFAEASTAIVHQPSKQAEENLLVIALKLDRPVDRALVAAWAFHDKTPSGVTLLANEKQGELPIGVGSDSENLQLQIDWTQIKNPLDFELELRQSEGLKLGKQIKHKVSIVPETTITFEFSKQKVQEGTDQSTTLTAKLNHAIDQDCKVSISIPSDAKLVQLPMPPFTVKAGQTTQDWRINIGNDSELNPNKYVRFSFQDILPAYIVQPYGINLQIVDDEHERKLALRISSPVNALKESEPGTGVEITGTLSEPVGETELIVPLVFQGTALLDEDFKTSSPQLVFKNSAVAKIQINAIADTRYDPDEFLLVTPKLPPTVTSNDDGVKIPLLDESKLKLAIVQSPARTIREGGQATLTFALEQSYRNLTGVVYPPFRFKIELPSSEAKSLINQLEVKGARRVTNDANNPEYEVSWDATTKPVTVSIAYLDDKQYRGTVPCEISFASPVYEYLNAKLEPLPNARLFMELDDNDTVPLSLSIAGKPEEQDGQKIYVLNEANPTESVTLKVKLLQTMSRPVEVPIYFVGQSNADDLVFPAGRPLVELSTQGPNRRIVRFEADQTEVSIPIKAKDDEDFEGVRVIKIRADRDSDKGQLLLKVMDDDPAEIAIRSGPFFVQEGGDAEVAIELVNAANGLVGEVELILESAENSTAQLAGQGKDVDIYWQGHEDVKLNPALFKFPANKREAKLIIKALPDEQEEGEEVLRLRLKLDPKFRTDFYTVGQADCLLRIQEKPQHKQRILAILVNSRLAKLWPGMQPAYSKFIEQFKDQLLGKGILLVGDNGTAVVWDGASKDLPVSPMATQATDQMLSTVLTAAAKQKFDRELSMRMILFWAAESSDAKVSEMVIPPGISAHVVVGLPESGQGATLFTSVQNALKTDSVHVIDSISPPLRDSAVISAFRKSFKENP